MYPCMQAKIVRGKETTVFEVPQKLDHFATTRGIFVKQLFQTFFMHELHSL